MKVVVPLLASLAIAVAIPIFVRILAAAAPSALAGLVAGGRSRRRPIQAAAPLTRLLDRLGPGATPRLSRVLAELELLLLAGLLLGALAGGFPGAVTGGVLGVAARIAQLRSQAARFEAAVLRDLPLTLDLLALAVEGGLPVGAALDLTARRGPAGPLRDALALVVAAVAAGRARHEALGDLSRALPLPAVAALVGSLVQADQLGGRLGAALSAQAAQRRAERWDRAERRALLAPVRLLLPLALGIFPATFVVLLVPLALRLAAGSIP